MMMRKAMKQYTDVKKKKVIIRLSRCPSCKGSHRISKEPGLSAPKRNRKSLSLPPDSVVYKAGLVFLVMMRKEIQFSKSGCEPGCAHPFNDRPERKKRDIADSLCHCNTVEHRGETWNGRLREAFLCGAPSQIPVTPEMWTSKPAAGRLPPSQARWSFTWGILSRHKTLCGQKNPQTLFHPDTSGIKSKMFFFFYVLFMTE